MILELKRFDVFQSSLFESKRTFPNFIDVHSVKASTSSEVRFVSGFVTDGNGVVVFGSAVKKASEADSTKLVYSYDTFQTYYDVDEEGKFTLNENGIPVGDGKLTDADFWVTIPAGGYAYSTKTQQNNAEILGKFCMIGDDLHITRFEPWYESPDGSTEGVGSFKHE